jgi:arsenite transporter
MSSKTVLPGILYTGVRREALAGDKAVVIVYTSVARHVNIAMAVILSTFPIESAPTMILLLIIGYILQVPSLAIYAQHYGREIAGGKS